MHAYRVRGLVRRYRSGVVANDGLDFDIEQGEIFGLLGPNGAGKTTLVKQLIGLLAPTSGSIQLFGHDVVATREVVTRYVSYIPQRAGALADLTAGEALALTGRLRGMARREAALQAGELAEEFGLTAFGRRPLGKLSGGEQRLVAFYLALMNRPPILVMDEPTNDLDPSHRRQVWEKLRQLNREQATTVILVTHNVVEAEKVLERVGIINRGRITALGTVGELKARVDRRVRLELRLNAEEAEARLAEFTCAEVRPLGRGHWLLLVERNSARDAIDRVMGDLGLASLDDFRILTPTLEDVYLQLGGGERLAREN
ncbi:MAG: ABC transporter ATP-binding protein [bacterium]|nr:ABC transporter ATP-binding protein [bacterium]